MAENEPSKRARTTTPVEEDKHSIVLLNVTSVDGFDNSGFCDPDCFVRVFRVPEKLVNDMLHGEKLPAEISLVMKGVCNMRVVADDYSDKDAFPLLVKQLCFTEEGCLVDRSSVWPFPSVPVGEVELADVQLVLNLACVFYGI